MRLGTRWTSGDEPPAAVPDELRARIREIDAHVAEDPRPHWTLTWLEGRPIADLETGLVVTIDSAGEVVVRHDDDEVEPD